MCAIKCFDAVEALVAEANKQFAPIWKLDEENYEILEQYCDVIDELSAKSNGESYEVEIDDITMTIAITMDCSDILINNKENNQLLTIAQHAVSISFSASDEGLLLVKFVFPSLWKRA